MAVTIAVDAMGGDHGPNVTAQAALRFLADRPEARILLVGRERELLTALKWARGDARDRIELRDATEVIEMHEPPANALRGKKDSSMRVAINAVKDGTAQACVSAGNTGALMAISRFVLKTLPGVDRPAIASELPTRQGLTTVLDLGANVNCSAEQLLQFAVMGSALVSAVHGIERPTIGLLNIGEEDIKGSDVVKEAGERLKASPLNFYGNVEGDDIYKGTTDVVVCDGFVGNVALKTSEGLARMLADFLREEFVRNPIRKALVVFALPAINAFKRRIDPRRYNGATLLGLRGVVVKSHGGADVYGFSRALHKAYTEVANGVLDRIAQRLAALPSPAPASAAVPAPDAAGARDA